jgi:carbon starvation protein
MDSVILILMGIILFFIAYRTYGRFISKKLNIDNQRKTPAHELNDGVDYVPAKSPVLLGHHFASIAGAGPILGPVIASTFGWVPVFIWIILGGIFFGGVHDMTALVASMRHRGKSIGQIIESYLGKGGKILFLIFAYLTLILVIAVFCKIVAKTFVTVPAVATSSILFIVVAIIFGVVIYRRKWPLLPTSIIGVALLFVCISLGSRYPISVYPWFQQPATQAAANHLVENGIIESTGNPATLRQAFTDNQMPELAQDIKSAEAKATNFWIVILLIYVFIAATTPVWALLQPRDYLNSFLLYILLIGGILGLFFTRPAILLPEMTQFKTNIGYLFPVLFVTVACGAISGFHSLVASGTTAKQINRETDAKLIGYGGMLIESALAILALLAAATIMRDRYDLLYRGGDFIAVFSEGVGWFMSKIPALGPGIKTAITFAGLAVSAFALTTLDTSTRLGRFMFQEFFENKETEKKSILVKNRFIGTAITILISALFIFSGSSGAIWPIFGSANQLLAALALLAVSVWLNHLKKANWFTVIPMAFMYILTLTALVTLIIQNLENGNYILSIIGFCLIVVSLLLGVQGIKKLTEKQPQEIA